MKKHLPTTGEAIQASVPARLHVHSPHAALSKPRATAARMLENAAATGTERCHAHGTAGTWQNTAFARIAPVFAPYHQRPKDVVT
jgi:hypothetical protein